MNIRRFLTFILLLGAICCTVQATTLAITVRDEIDNTPVSGASLYIDGNYVGSTNSEGAFTYSHSLSSSFRLGINKDGYKYWSDQLTAGQTAVVADLIRGTGILQINVMDSETLLPVEDALVKISGADATDSESTNSEGLAQFEVYLGTTYIVEVQMTSYETLSKSVDVGDSSKKVDYLLQRNDLVIFQILDGESEGTKKSPLADAQIYINGNLAGETESDGRVTLYLEHEKSYEIGVQKDQYESFEEDHYLASDEILYTVTLSKSLYPVTVSVYDIEKRPVSDAEIYIDGNLFGKSDSYGRSSVTKLSSGNHVFLIRKAGYDDYEVSIDINGSNDNVIADLSYSKAAVTVIVQDNDNKLVPGAVVYANGNNLGITDVNGKITTELLTNNDYNFVVTASDYKEFEEVRQIPLGSTEITITLVLEKELNLILLGAVLAAVIVLLAAGFYRFKSNGRSGGRGGNKKRPPRRYDDGGL
ncbi:MAG: Ig-like domain-containing protein [Methanomicrobiaceae archaeon]|nr:Ig-like domain-containing protein [Methanomicrobiaceae archaeon]